LLVLGINVVFYIFTVTFYSNTYILNYVIVYFVEVPVEWWT
jgi:hypothetical protein